MTELEINCELVTRLLTKFLETEVKKVGFERVVIGLSGGIDSAVSAYLGVRSLGNENVAAVLMPHKVSSPDSREDALRVIGNLEIEYHEVDITPMVQPYFEKYSDMDEVRRGNVMARMRMIVLYDYSLQLNALVLGTSNKTEALLGYTTLWGDMAASMTPIGDLYKTQVRALAKYLDVPQSIRDKKPTADLWQGQTDEDELGFTYANVDRLLYYIIDKRMSDEELLELGFKPDFISTVRDQVRRSQFKRRMPLIAKLSHRTVEKDFKYPRDWGV